MTDQTISTNMLTKDEKELVEKYRKTVRMGYAEGTWKIHAAELTHIWIREDFKIR